MTKLTSYLEKLAGYPKPPSFLSRVTAPEVQFHEPIRADWWKRVVSGALKEITTEVPPIPKLDKYNDEYPDDMYDLGERTIAWREQYGDMPIANAASTVRRLGNRMIDGALNTGINVLDRIIGGPLPQEIDGNKE